MRIPLTKPYDQLVMRIGALALAACVALFAQADAAERNLAKDGLALGGYDPVSYFNDEGPVKGNESIVAEVDGAIYRFASEENRERFLDSPEAFEPACGGWCAWAMLESDKVEIDPLSYRIFDGKLLVFYDGFWGDTRRKWERLAKEEGEATLFEQIAENWDKLESK